MISKSVLLLCSLMLFAMTITGTKIKKQLATQSIDIQINEPHALLQSKTITLNTKSPLQVRCLKKGQKATSFTPRSCLDYFKEGYKSNGFYKIYLHDIHGSTLTVYCDMNSEAGAAWTLVESFALKNAKMPEFRTKGLPANAPVNENSPNWNLYRMTLANMKTLKSQSTHWRATCSFPTHAVDYTDYVRANFVDFDIMTFLGGGVCKKVEFVNIRGHRCVYCTSRWWQGSWAAHIDSSHTGCQFNPTAGSTSSEDNFAQYDGVINKKFRCASGPSSTTNWWFGGYQ